MPFPLSLKRIHVFAPDLDGARAFYADVLGLRLKETHDGLLRFAGADFEIDVFRCEGPSDLDGYSRFAGCSAAFAVPCVDTAMRALREQGVNVLHEVPNTAADGTRYAAFADPFGTVFEVIEAASPGVRANDPPPSAGSRSTQ